MKLFVVVFCRIIAFEGGNILKENITQALPFQEG